MRDMFGMGNSWIAPTGEPLSFPLTKNMIRKGTPVAPGKAEWTIQGWTADPTSGSLRQKGIGGARSSCPVISDGRSNVNRRTRQAGPSERRTRQARPSDVVGAILEWPLPSAEPVGCHIVPGCGRLSGIFPKMIDSLIMDFSACRPVDSFGSLSDPGKIGKQESCGLRCPPTQAGNGFESDTQRSS